MAGMNVPAFISYARKDSAIALRIEDDLKQGGANVWLDQLDIRLGRQWDREVEQALNACREMIVVLSAAAIDSSNVMDEVAYALEERKTVIPVLIHNCRIPLRLRRLQYVDLTSDYDSGLKRLLDTLAAESHEEVATAAPSASPPVRTPTPPYRESTLADMAPFSPEQAQVAEEDVMAQAEAALSAEQDRIAREQPEAARKAERDHITPELTEAVRKSEHDRTAGEQAEVEELSQAEEPSQLEATSVLARTFIALLALASVSYALRPGLAVIAPQVQREFEL